MDYIPSTLFTIADAKRGDIGNTSAYYAKTYFDYLNCDSVTVAFDVKLSDEHDDYVWCSMDYLNNLELVPNVKDDIKKALNIIKPIKDKSI